MAMLINRQEAKHHNEPIGTLRNRQYFNASYTNFPRHDLSLADKDYSRERSDAINCNSKDGVKPMTKEEQEYERKLNWQLVKQFTMAIFKMDPTGFSFPVGYNEPRTFVERATDLFSFLVTKYIDEALQKQDQSQRLAYLSVGIIAGFHLYLQQKKPWNPLLGESYVGEWPDGTRMYGEQTSHHPPVSNIQIYPPHGNWRIDAQFNFKIDPGVITVHIKQSGVTKLILKDGTTYEWEFPTIAVSGILSGDRVIRVKGPLLVHDITHGLDCLINVNPSKSETKHFKKTEEELIRMNPEQVAKEMKDEESTSEKKKKSKDTKDNLQPGEAKYKVTEVQGGVAKKDTTDFTVLIKGDYCGQVLVGNTVAWDISKDLTSRPLKEIPDEDLLPSDCRFRIDRAMLIEQDEKAADQAKSLIEELQRHDYKLRDSVSKKDNK